MKKLFSLAAVAALVVSACGTGSGNVAASVDGADITVGQVESLMVVDGSTIPKERFAEFLGFQILWNIKETAAADEFGIEIAEGEVDAEADQIYDSTNAGETRDEFTASRGVTEEFLRDVARQGLLDTAISAELEEEVVAPSQEQIDAEMAVAAAALTTVCVSHILVSTAGESQDVVDRLDAGEDFAEVAGDVSQDPGSGANGGVLACGSAGQYVVEFRDATLIAPVGEIYSEVVETQFGFHIMLVTDREDPAPEDLPTEDVVAESLTATVALEQLSSWFGEHVVASEVVVVEDYGTWTTNPPGVTPPAA